MGEPVIFSVSVDETERLDRFIADQLSMSRTRVGRLIAEGGVSVNKKQGKAGHRLCRRDIIEVSFPDEELSSRRLLPHHRDINVIFEDESFLILDKPGDLVVHPAPGHWQDTLLNVLVARGTKIAGGDEGRPGIVHRLDRDTSGLIVVSKTEVAHRRLSKAMGQRRIKRVYAALVWGHVVDCTVDEPIGRHPQDRKRMMVTPLGRSARTEVKQVARFRTCDLVRLTLDTGRTHQIRVHLAHIGHPVVGDPVYGGGGAKRVSGPDRPIAELIDRKAQRQALHAAELTLRHPMSGEEMVFRSDWPDDLRGCIVEAAEDQSLLARASMLEYLGLF